MNKQNMAQLNTCLIVGLIVIAIVGMGSYAMGSFFECTNGICINQPNQSLDSQAGIMMPFTRLIQ